jgi:predicted Zn-dependent protease
MAKDKPVEQALTQLEDLPVQWFIAARKVIRYGNPSKVDAVEESIDELREWIAKAEQLLRKRNQKIIDGMMADHLIRKSAEADAE